MELAPSIIEDIQSLGKSEVIVSRELLLYHVLEGKSLKSFAKEMFLPYDRVKDVWQSMDLGKPSDVRKRVAELKGTLDG